VDPKQSNLQRHAVFDCNVYLQAIISSRGPAHECWRRVLAGDVTLYVSQEILAEIRALSEHVKLRRFRQLSPDKLDAFTIELLSVAVLVKTPPEVFQYPRDPDDALYVNLAVATNSMLVVSNDRDLLDLMLDDNLDGKRLRTIFPQFCVVTPPALLSLLAPNQK
jgi:putative PIN family toxin of toxin-antitoxin system